MPNTKTAKKQMLITKRNRARNVHVISTLKTIMKKARIAIEDGTNEEEARSAMNAAVKALQRSATKRVIKRGNASRRVSRMMLAFNRKFGKPVEQTT